VDGDGYSQNTGCYLFGITITLTDAGLNAGEGFGLAAVELMFNYLNMLRNQGGYCDAVMIHTFGNQLCQVRT